MLRRPLERLGVATNRHRRCQPPKRLEILLALGDSRLTIAKRRARLATAPSFDLDRRQSGQQSPATARQRVNEGVQPPVSRLTNRVPPADLNRDRKQAASPIAGRRSGQGGQPIEHHAIGLTRDKRVVGADHPRPLGRIVGAKHGFEQCETALGGRIEPGLQRGPRCIPKTR